MLIDIHFYSFGTKSNAARNNCVLVFVLTYIFSFLEYIPGAYSNSMFNFLLLNQKEDFFFLMKGFDFSHAFSESTELIIWFSLSFF